jgi:hypothetical protein
LLLELRDRQDHRHALADQFAIGRIGKRGQHLRPVVVDVLAEHEMRHRLAAAHEFDLDVAAERLVRRAEIDRPGVVHHDRVEAFLQAHDLIGNLRAHRTVDRHDPQLGRRIRFACASGRIANGQRIALGGPIAARLIRMRCEAAALVEHHFPRVAELLHAQRARGGIGAGFGEELDSASGRRRHHMARELRAERKRGQDRQLTRPRGAQNGNVGKPERRHEDRNRMVGKEGNLQSAHAQVAEP